MTIGGFYIGSFKTIFYGNSSSCHLFRRAVAIPKITFDVSGSDPDKATQSLEPPKPGVYKGKVEEINSGFSKNDEGKPDKSRPRLEIVYRIVEGKYKGAPLWDYLSFSEAAQWKLDQFLQAVGVANKKKRKGVFESAKVIGTLVKIHVTGEGAGDTYRARVRSVLEWADAEEDVDEDDEEEDDSEDDDAEDEDTDEDDEDEEEDESEEEDEDDEDEDSEDSDEEEDESEEEDEDDEDEDSEDSDEDEDEIVKLGRAADDDDKKAIRELKKIAKEAGKDPDDYDTWLELAEALAAPSEEEPEDGYDDLDLKALKVELKSRKLKTVGDKDVLIARLRESDASEDPF